MAIIGEQPRWRDARSLFEGGLRVMASVVRYRQYQGWDTGWFITPRLLVRCTQANRRSLLDATVDVDGASVAPVAHWVSDPMGQAEIDAGYREGESRLRSSLARIVVVVIELPATIRGAPLTLSLEKSATGTPVHVLGFPMVGDHTGIVYSGGQIVGMDATGLYYDADTSVGTGGAPLFDSDWRVIGMHVGTGPFRAKLNFGITTPDLIAALRASPYWSEIAAWHRLVTVAEVPEPDEKTSPEPTHVALRLRAAVCWNFDPDRLGAAARELLAEDVIDRRERRWTLRADVRREVLAEAGAIEVLQGARAAVTEALPDTIEQRAIDRILAGPPFAIDSLGEDDLAAWIPAVRWFGAAVADLPPAGALADAVAVRRLRGRLARWIGEHFTGRDDEHAVLTRWLADDTTGPMVVSGPGGVGKSALLARFVLDASPPCLFAWLDFDSAELAPDDARAMLVRIAGALALQVPALRGWQPPSTDWITNARALGAALAAAAPAPRLILVLDSFETAQYEGRQAALWPLLAAFGESLPGLRVIVSGRAPVRDLVLAGRAAVPLALRSLTDGAARAWLAEKEITEPRKVEAIVTLTQGLPLGLVLAARLSEAGDDFDTFEKALPQELVEGYLYRRVLDRVIAEPIREVARASLVVRRLTEAMLLPVLGAIAGFDAAAAPRLFAGLAKEMSLVDVETAGVLKHRPDVRHAALQLLERDDAARVRRIDLAAERWLRDLDPTDPDVATELVYHRLRLGDLAGAAAVWTPALDEAIRLRMGTYALDELRGEARAWLATKKLEDRPREKTLAEWETDAALRIREALGRHRFDLVPVILGERPERSPDSPLHVLAAYTRWREGDDAGAADLLARADASGHAGDPARCALRAAIALDRFDRAGATRALDAAGPMRDDLDLALAAARIRLDVDLAAEEAFFALCQRAPALCTLVGPIDLVLPYVQELVAQVTTSSAGLESAAPPTTSVDVDVSSGATRVHEVFAEAARSGPHERQVLARLLDAALSPEPLAATFDAAALRARALDALTPIDVDGHLRSPDGLEAIELALRLGWLARRRRRHAQRSNFLSRCYALTTKAGAIDVPLARSTLAVVAAFSSQRVELSGPAGSVEAVIARWLLRAGLEPHPIRGWDPARAMLVRVPNLDPTPNLNASSVQRVLAESGRGHWLPAVLFVLEPSPLGTLVQRLVEPGPAVR